MSDFAPDGVKFSCDSSAGGLICPIVPKRAVAIMVPRTGYAIAHAMDKNYRPLRMFTTAHFCEVHRIDIDQKKFVQDFLTPKVKTDFEQAARYKRGDGFKCDFEAAFLTWHLVTTPEYRSFLAALGFEGVMGAAKLTDLQQQDLRRQLGVKRVADMT